MTTAGSSPTTQASWPLGSEVISPGPATNSVPSSMRIASWPLRWYWKCGASQLCVPAIGLTSLDQRQPGSKVYRPTSPSPILRISARPFGNSRVSSGCRNPLCSVCWRVPVVAISVSFMDRRGGPAHLSRDARRRPSSARQSFRQSPVKPRGPGGSGVTLAPVLVRLLGALEVEVEGEQVALPPGKPRSLFAWLALHRGLHARRELAGRLWPDVLDSSARASLRSALWALRSALGPAAPQLEATRERVGLTAAVQTDLGEFRRRLAAGDLTGAVDLCRGRLLSDLDDEWVLETRLEHERELSAVFAELAAEAGSGEDRVAAIRWARRRLSLDPLSEEAARDLMRMLAAAGDRAGVLTTYDQLRARFRTELGIGPSEETRALAREGGRSDAAVAQRAE